MSGKQKSSLTFEASLGACLSFAGQVLSAASPLVQVCTKEVLSPIVVEAHRFGQQVGKSCGSSSADSVDPRKLLKKLQTHQREPEGNRADGQIDRLAFEDLTWDSQGEVAQTLEMELVELENRAAETNLSVCVLMTLRASTDDAKATMFSESAILWLPLENHQGSNNGKKHYLLYACPGRIKVVRSVVELLKKLREEVKLINDSDAVYNVWTLSRSAASQIKKKPPAAVSKQPREPEKTQVATPRNDKVLEKAGAVVDAMKEKPEEASLMAERRSLPKEVVAEPQSRRPMSIRPVQNEACVLSDSIFRFTNEPIMRDQVERGATSEHLNSVRRRKKEILEDEESSFIAGELTPRQQQVVSPLKEKGEEGSLARSKAHPRRQVVSSSYSNGFQTSARPGSTRNVQRELLWQSLDSDLKKPVLPQAPQATDTGKPEMEIVATDNDQSVSPIASNCVQRDEVIADVDSESSQQILHSPPDKTNSSVFACSEPASASYDSSQLQSNEPHLASQQCDIRCAEALENSYQRQSRASQVKNSSPGAANSDIMDQDRLTASLIEVKADIGDDRGSQSDSRKLVPSRKNYKAKLGNRVWWELQCAAEKLLQEEQTVEPAKRANHAEQHAIRKPNPPSEHRAVKGISSRSPFKDTKPQQVDTRSERKPSSSGAISPVPHSKPAEIILTEDEIDSVPVHLQVFAEDEEPVQIASVTSRSTTTREFVQARVPEYEPPAACFAADKKAPSEATRAIKSSDCSSQLTPDESHDEPHRPLFTKTAAHLEQGQDFATNDKGNKLQHSAQNAPATARQEALSHNDVKASKKVGMSKSTHVKSSKESDSSPRAFDFYAEEQVETRDATRAPEPRKGHNANIKWNSKAHNVNRSCDADDDDDELVQNQWTSTRTSYAVEREADQETPTQRCFEPPATSQIQAETKTPFNVHGRVPIRCNRDVPPKCQYPQFDDVDSSSDEEGDTMDRFEPTTRTPIQLAQKVCSTTRLNYHQEIAEDDASNLNVVKAKPQEVDRQPPHVATFITFEQDIKTSSKKATSTASTATANQKHQTQSREEKLAELRQKKLSQLHRAREEQQQQQQKKKSSLLLQKATLTLTAQAGVFDEHFAPTSTPGKAIPAGATTHLRTAKKPSNKKLIQNALEYTLLAGFSMEKERNAALQALALSSCDNFIVLLKSTRDLKFRALYEHHTDREEVVKLFASASNAPLMLTGDTIGQFFKYNSGKKEFVAIDSRAFTMKTDACALKDELVFKKKAGLGKLL